MRFEIQGQFTEMMHFVERLFLKTAVCRYCFRHGNDFSGCEYDQMSMARNSLRMVFFN